MPTVLLLRHGQASFGAADYDVLSPLGSTQSVALGGELRRRDVRPDQVWSGSLNRQRDTASACLSAAGIATSCQVDPRWDEYDHVGLVREHGEFPEGRPTAPREFQLALERALSAWLTDGAGRRFLARAAEVLDETFDRLGPGGTALVFTSGGVISAVCARLLGLSAEGFLALNRVTVNGGITKVVHGRGGTTLVSFNEHSHLEGPSRELISYR